MSKFGRHEIPAVCSLISLNSGADFLSSICSINTVQFLLSYRLLTTIISLRSNLQDVFAFVCVVSATLQTILGAAEITHYAPFAAPQAFSLAHGGVVCSTLAPIDITNLSLMMQ